MITLTIIPETLSFMAHLVFKYVNTAPTNNNLEIAIDMKLQQLAHNKSL